MAQDDGSEPVGLIETFVEGTPLSFFDSPPHQETRFGSIAEVAAAVHQLPQGAFGHLEAATDRRFHILGMLDALPKAVFAAYPIAAAVRDWIQAHLPEGLSVVLHGDLLPQRELVSAAAVRVHELLLHLNWLAETDQAQKAGVREGQGPDFYENQLTSLARRVCV